jgi:N-acetylmuramoyl-L-alanine amidase
MAYFSARFQAPSDSIVIAVRALKKWGTTQRELDVNLDVISLAPCSGEVPDACIHVVARGETLGIIAKKYHTTIAVLVKLNGLKNPNVLLVGQRLKVPCGDKPPVVVIVDDDHKPPVSKPPHDGKSDDGAKPPDGDKPDNGECTWYVVQRGDTVGKLAAHYSTSVKAIAVTNQLKNANLIYVGQKLCIPGQ